jgi:hypothetical protein
VTMIGFPLAERPDVVNAVRRAWNAKVVHGLVSITFVRYGNVGPEVIPTGQDKVMVGIPQTMDVTSIEEFLRMGGACTIRDLLSRYEQKLQMRRALSEQNTHSASPILQKRIPVFLEVSDVHQHSRRHRVSSGASQYLPHPRGNNGTSATNGQETSFVLRRRDSSSAIGHADPLSQTRWKGTVAGRSHQDVCSSYRTARRLQHSDRCRRRSNLSLNNASAPTERGRSFRLHEFIDKFFTRLTRQEGYHRNKYTLAMSGGETLDEPAGDIERAIVRWWAGRRPTESQWDVAFEEVQEVRQRTSPLHRQTRRQTVWQTTLRSNPRHRSENFARRAS